MAKIRIGVVSSGRSLVDMTCKLAIEKGIDIQSAYVGLDDAIEVAKEMEADGDFEIIDAEGNTVKNSKRTNSGADQLRNFYLSSGSYNIKIWNYSRDSSTDFILRVYRQ